MTTTTSAEFENYFYPGGQPASLASRKQRDFLQNLLDRNQMGADELDGLLRAHGLDVCTNPALHRKLRDLNRITASFLIDLLSSDSPPRESSTAEKMGFEELGI